MFQLIGEKRKLENRTGDKVRKHRDETGKIDEVRHRLGLAAINVDRVTERLKCVKADPERENHAKERVPLGIVKSKAVNQRVVTIDSEVEVFEEAQANEIGNNRRRDRDAPRACSAMSRIDNFDRFAPFTPNAP